MKSYRSAILASLWLVIAAYPLIEGWTYYHAPLEERAYLELHEDYRPSGIVGQGLGILGSLFMLVGVSSYMLRKRVPALQRLGKLRDWLTFHIFLCTLGPFLVLLHTTFKFGNIASISFWSMAIVVASGVFGRYVYVHIPKTANGHFFTASDLMQARVQMSQRLAALTGLGPAQIESLVGMGPAVGGLAGALAGTVRFQFSRHATRARLAEHLEELGVPADRVETALPLALSHQEMQLRQQTLAPFVRAFGYWHVLHIPLALVMLAAFLIHIAVAIAFGYTWIL